MSTAANTVHVRINDHASGQSSPVRLRISGADGEYFAPLGRLARFAVGRNQDVGGNLSVGHRAYSYIDGTCEVRLPGGPLHIELHKGFEYLPRHLEIDHVAGKISLRLEIERWIDLRQQNWYSGDTRAHFLTPHAALLEAQAEDLAVVHLLALDHAILGPGPNELSALSNIHAFSGQSPALAKPGHMVVVNTHNIHPVLGSLGLLHCHRPVYPLRFGDRPGWEKWTLADWCQQCHRKRGLVVWTDTAHETPTFRHGEPLADLILGHVDAFEITFWEDSPFDALPDWYALLNCGLRVPLVGASGKDCNRVALGAMRTYARLRNGEELSTKAWIEAVRAGRSFVTNGPLLSLTVAGRDPGSIVAAAENETLPVVAEAKSAASFDCLELLVNGKVEAHSRASGTPVSTAKLELVLPIAKPCWIAARCRGSQQVLSHPSNQRVFAHTSPVFVESVNTPFPRDPQAVARFGKELDRMSGWARYSARSELVNLFEAAQAQLQRG